MKTSEEALSKIVVNVYHDEDIPDPDQQYVGEITEGPYRCVVTSNSVPGVFKELSISMRIMDEYKAMYQL